MDAILGGPKNDTLDGRGGPDIVVGGSTASGAITGDDTITASGDGAQDVVYGQDGNDTIKSKDATQDVVSCGSGSDLTTLDTLDMFPLHDCENGR